MQQRQEQMLHAACFLHMLLSRYVSIRPRMVPLSHSQIDESDTEAQLKQQNDGLAE